MGNKWHEIWEKRTENFAAIDINDVYAVFAELKRINGFDITDGGIPLAALVEQYKDTKEKLKVLPGASVFEVGCGSGANLYMFYKDGFEVGGIDYSRRLIDIIQQVFPAGELKECLCGEAKDLPVDIKYDAILSDGVFHYFQDLAYAQAVLEKIVAKAEQSIGLLDIHDLEKQEAFFAWRRENTEDYDERYKDLPKLFYPKEFFSAFAQAHDLRIEFYSSEVEGYWNNEFIYNVFMYK